MADCITISCMPEALITRIRQSIVRLDSGCLAIRIKQVDPDIDFTCSPLACNTDFQNVESTLQRTVLDDYILVRSNNTFSEIITCDHFRSMDELIAGMLGQSEEECFFLFVTNPFDSSGCEQSCDTPIQIEELIRRTILKNTLSGCNMFVITQSDEGYESLTCDEQQQLNDETLMRMLIEPLSANLFAWRTVNVPDNPRERCYTWQWITSDPTSHALKNIESELQTIPINAPLWDAGHLTIPVETIIQTIKDALDSAGIGYGDVTLDTVATQSETTFTFTISHPTEILLLAHFDDNDIEINSEICD